MTGALYLATSCLQGRPLAAAFDELALLDPAGIQLTPGNAPEPHARARIEAAGKPLLVHHGFCWRAMRQAVWSGDGTCLVTKRSVHPPARRQVPWPAFARFAERAHDRELVVEVMPPTHHLGQGAEVEWAMDRGLPLALDVSHVFIQIEQGVMPTRTWRRLRAYDHVREIHVSANDGRRDQHRPLAPDTFGLAFARARAADGIFLVLESYLHRSSTDERRRQVDLCRE